MADDKLTAVDLSVAIQCEAGLLMEDWKDFMEYIAATVPHECAFWEKMDRHAIRIADHIRQINELAAEAGGE